MTPATVLATLRTKATAAGASRWRLLPTKAGKRALKAARKAKRPLRLNVVVRYTPTGGRAQVVRTDHVKLRPWKRHGRRGPASRR
ncbi:MAG TPA: hypothetical protein VFT50_00765 [Baekduia sp.]|nr:hypothetical protein [Baekduia sp.]